VWVISFAPRRVILYQTIPGVMARSKKSRIVQDTQDNTAAAEVARSARNCVSAYKGNAQRIESL